jgi:hypothetical protein
MARDQIEQRLRAIDGWSFERDAVAARSVL